jgi:hypothetical protein
MLDKTMEHILIARKMPRKKLCLSTVHETKEGKKYARAQRKLRCAIANKYRFIRNDPEHGPQIARIAHRAGLCID